MDALPDAGDRRKAVESQATLLNLELAAGPSVSTPPSGSDQSALLLDAGREAVRRGISRVVWPVQAFPDGRTDLPALARICDRALLVGQLLSLDAPADRPVRIETPLADLSDAQILELALDLDAPLSACWRSDNDLPLPRPGSAAGENPMHVYTRPRPAAAVGGGSAAR